VNRHNKAVISYMLTYKVKA